MKKSILLDELILTNLVSANAQNKIDTLKINSYIKDVVNCTSVIRQITNFKFTRKSRLNKLKNNFYIAIKMKSAIMSL